MRRRAAWPGQLPVYLVGLIIFLNGAFSVAVVLVARFAAHPHLYTVALPLGLYHVSRLLTLFSGFMLIYLSLRLLQRRRVAWYIAVGILSVSFLAHIGRGAAWYVPLAPALTIVLLVLFRKRYTVRSEVRSVSRGLELALVGVAVALVYGIVGFWLLDRPDFGVTFSLGGALMATLRQLSLLGNPGLTPETVHARWFLESLSGMGIVAGIFAAYSLFRPVAFRIGTLPHERALARKILSEYGDSSLDFYKLWTDKAYYFSHDRQCFIAYGVSMGVALALGGPSGPDEALAPVIDSFVRFCSENGWGVAFLMTERDVMYRELGLGVLKIGEEAVVDLRSFDATAGASAHFRRVDNRLRARGYTVDRSLPPHTPALLGDLESISREWLSLPGRQERGFFQGTFHLSYLREMPVFMVREPTGNPVAFVNQVPSYRAGQATADLMRHRVEVPNSVMDYLFAGMLRQLLQEGYDSFSLGLAPLSGVGDTPGAGTRERVIHQIYVHLNRVFSFRGLYSWKAKYEPTWEDRFIAYLGGLPGLLGVALAMSRISSRPGTYSGKISFKR